MGAGTERYPAPAVEYPIERSGRLAAVLLLLHVGSLAILAAWLLRDAGALRAAVLPVLLVWSAAAALGAHFWMRQPVGRLAWDGTAWQLRRAAGGSAAQALGPTVVVQLDLQRQMALAFPQAAPPVWLFVEQRQQSVRWLDLRRAVYSRPNAARPSPASCQHGERMP
ncbi:hypothetical protein [Simplicispira hankyongi]|uniref:Toxin CptA n=1 Tax=Simplicispira hankyongi TaxID=2315688 RepID=A0A398CLX8_9BURK|nr:hypothetical protein [Simplicispira hankyongi]MBU6465131.1 hypothetical protein [Burkholderiales bacterium]RID99903.1 hypothetical protein D3F03_05875 [Simplicispira hankyongi]